MTHAARSNELFYFDATNCSHFRQNETQEPGHPRAQEYNGNVYTSYTNNCQALYLPLQSQGRGLPLGLSTSTHHIAHVDHDESKGAQDCHRPV